jgi:hypothetical protein
MNPRIAKSKKLVCPRMSDMSDMTIEMLKRLERTLDQLSETDLIRVSYYACLVYLLLRCMCRLVIAFVQVKGVCTIVGNKCDAILTKLRAIDPAPQAATSSAAATAAPPSKLSIKPVIQDPRKKAESEADKFFGISEPLSESGEPIRKTQGRPEPDLSFLKQQAKIQEQKAVSVSASSVSKYLEIKPDSSSRNFATDEAVVGEDEWTKAYIQVRRRALHCREARRLDGDCAVPAYSMRIAPPSSRMLIPCACWAGKGDESLPVRRAVDIGVQKSSGPSVQQRPIPPHR